MGGNCEVGSIHAPKFAMNGGRRSTNGTAHPLHATTVAPTAIEEQRCRETRVLGRSYPWLPVWQGWHEGRRGSTKGARLAVLAEEIERSRLGEEVEGRCGPHVRLAVAARAKTARRVAARRPSRGATVSRAEPTPLWKGRLMHESVRDHAVRLTPLWREVRDERKSGLPHWSG